jgi:hypothetical protein
LHVEANLLDYSMEQQLELIPAVPAPAPIKVGDTIVNRRGVRHTVQLIDDNIDGLVFVCERAIVLEREVAAHLPQSV